MEIFSLKNCLVLLFATFVIVESDPTVSFGFLDGSSGDKEAKVCSSYVVPGQPLPTNIDQTELYLLYDLTDRSVVGCQSVYNISKEHLGKSLPFHLKIVAVNYNKCVIDETALITQRLGGKGLLMVGTSLPPATQPPLVALLRDIGVTIPIGFLSNNSFKTIQNLGQRISVSEYAPVRKFYMEFATLIVWLLSVGSIALGTIWDEFIDLPLNKNDGTDSYQINGNSSDENKNNPRGKEEIKDVAYDKKAAINAKNKLLGSSIIKIVIFLIIVTGIQILLYFFYDVFIYVVYGLFFFITVPPTFSLIMTFRRFLLPCLSYEIKIRQRKIEIRSVILFLLSAALFAVWVVFRLESYGWIFQDLLVLFAIIRMTGRLHMYDLKICVVILVLLTIYFTFLIFGTSSMIPEGKSILEVVMVGKGSPTTLTGGREKLPMTIRIPQISMDPLSVCTHRESGISLIDVIVPGGVVAYCYTFGAKTGGRLPYFLTALAGFGLGLGLTFIVQTVTMHIQPALLFISPCILISVIIVSIIRKEFTEFWNGEPEMKHPSGRRRYAEVAQNETNF